MSGGGDFQKTPAFASLQRIAQNKARAAIELLGKALPASVTKVQGSIVTVKFELTNVDFNIPNVTIPIFGPEYIRYPIQTGCKGVVFPADVSIGGMSGLGPANADLTQQSNLSQLVFVPIGNSGWQAADHPNHLTLYGADGSILQSTIQKEWYVETTVNGITFSNNAGTASLAWNGAAWEFKGPVIFNNGMQLSGNITAIGGGTYAGNFLTSGTVQGGTVQQGTIVLGTHRHTGVQTGGGTSGGPTP